MGVGTYEGLVFNEFPFFFFFFFFFFMATPEACGSSQAMGQIGASVVTVTATPDPSYICNLHHSS